MAEYQLIIINGVAASTVEGDYRLVPELPNKRDAKQQFRFVTDAAGIITVEPRTRAPKVLDISNEGKKENSEIIVYNKGANKANQQWRRTSEGYLISLAGEKLSPKKDLYMGFDQGKLVAVTTPVKIDLEDAIVTFKVTLENKSDVPVKVEVTLSDGTTQTIDLPPKPAPAKVLDLDKGGTLKAASNPAGTPIEPTNYTITKEEAITFDGKKIVEYDLVFKNDAEFPITVTDGKTTWTIPAGGSQSVKLPEGTKITAKGSGGEPVTPNTATITSGNPINFKGDLGEPLTEEEKKTIEGWFPPGTTFSEMYSDAKHGSHAKDFRAKTNGQGPALVVIASTDGYKFGGYAPLGFKTGTDETEWKTHDDLFTFSLKNPSGSPPRQFKVTKKEKAPHGYAYAGIVHVTLGYPNGVVIWYEGKTGSFDFSADCTLEYPDVVYWTGKQNFLVQSIQVYKVIFKK